jgi:hypothetical protein
MSPFQRQDNTRRELRQSRTRGAGYIFVFAIGMITGGRLGNILGHRRIFLVGFAAFTLTSALWLRA